MKRSALWILGGLFLTGTAHSQPAQIQAIRPSGAESLSRNLSRLASNPRDVDALIGAGEAAIDMDDVRAAAGFFGRADAIQPNNGRVKAGLARVMLKSQNPSEALRLFDQATRLGFGEATLLADRGLARDMTGDQAGAQRDYQAALKRAPEDAELLYRYAASLGISGQLDAAEKVLQPLLYKSDRAAWRYRAFILAMNNKQADARKIANQTMPAQLAAALSPYMEKMPYLTPAQKAAAVHFGHFPTRVGTSLAAATPRPAVPAPVAAAPESPAPAPVRPSYQSPGASNARVQPMQPDRPMPAARLPVQSQPMPSRAPATAPAPSSLTPSSLPPRSADVQGPPAPGVSSTASQSASAATTASQPNAITLARASAPAVQQAAPALAARQQPNPEATRTLAEIIRAIDVPETERRSTIAAVDLSEIQALQAARRAERQAAAEKAKKTAAAVKAKADAAAKAKAEADAKAKKAAEEKARLAANPSRNWVQIGTGADRGALAFTLKGLRRKYDDVAPQDGWLASWGRTNRLLIGPFTSFTRAKTVESKLKSAGADAFAWQSEAGEVVERLGGK
ncbi:tetratricopeptide repeat protein [Sphingobium sp. EP60837]|uniref:tetratricopeptide repeat protein n=1 Tax=Sphingobium sp. EP60837 TaxID=1855519 RepID=UPI0007DD0DEA|nr:tetratricopeptide repeat protein [Sphingobium sp. EP60837]ANI78591.1 DNA-directed DNA polymerase [Sphingobium sp. EP60837]